MVAISFAVGVCIDRRLNVSLLTWLGIGSGLLLVWTALFSRGRYAAATASLLGLWVTLGAAAHHSVWSVAGPDHILTRAEAEPGPIQLTGTIVTRPSVRPKSEHSDDSRAIDRTLCMVDVESVAESGARVQITGRVQLSVSGHLIAETGDVVRVRGQIERPRGAANPGEFDYRDWLRRDGVHAVVRVHDPLAVEVLQRPGAADFCWWQNRSRRIADDILRSTLSLENYTIASAILLGDRDGITRELRSTFTESGTMHLLAISGLHVGILAWFLWSLARLLRLPPAGEVAFVLVFVLLYLLIADLRPSVVRAGVLVLGLMLSRLWYRRVSAANALGLAALVVLIRSPTDVFDVGAQLSFLAVAAIAWATRQPQLPPPASDVTDCWRRRCWRWSWWTFRRDFRVMLTVTAVTAPLVAWSFHLYAPVGLAINLVLIRLVFGVMIAGYSLLVTGFLVPGAAFLPAAVFAPGLWLLRETAHYASLIDLGHRYGPAPPLLWTTIFYGLVLACLITVNTVWSRRAVWLVLAWTAAGLVGGTSAEPPSRLRCTVLAVGHGSSVLLETPDGRTLVVDNGSLDSPVRAARVLQGCLWDRGYSRVNTLILTHADADHFNGFTHLIQETPVGEVLTTHQFVKSMEPAVSEFRQQSREFDLPTRTLARGMTIRAGDGVTLEVLHPPRPPIHRFEDDNAASLVLKLHYAGRSILLTGDISGSGLDQLMARQTEPIDVLIAPHHGSRSDNPPALNQWARPSVVVASSNQTSTAEVLAESYPRAKKMVTAREGAVTIEITSDGRLTVEPFLKALGR